VKFRKKRTRKQPVTSPIGRSSEQGKKSLTSSKKYDRMGMKDKGINPYLNQGDEK